NNINKLVNSDSWQELFLRATTLINPATKPFIDPELNRQDITRGGQSGFINSRVEELTNSTLKEQLALLKTEQQVYGDLLNDFNNGDVKLRDALSKQTDLVSALEKRFSELNPIVKKAIEIPDAQLKSWAEITKRINELKKLPGSAIIGDDVYNRIQALRDRLKELSGTKVRVEPESGSFAALQKELNKLKAQADSTVVGSDTFKRIQELEKRIKTLGEIMKNPVTLSDMLKKNFEATVKALDKMDFSGLKITGITDITKAIDNLVDRDWVDSNGRQLQLETGGSVDSVARQAHEWNQAISNGLKNAAQSSNE